MTKPKRTTPKVVQGDFDARLDAYERGYTAGLKQGRQQAHRGRYRLTFEDMDQWGQSLHRACALVDLLTFTNVDELDNGTVAETAAMITRELLTIREVEQTVRQCPDTTPTEDWPHA